ncbi:MAG: coproporphyrinogen-III oxidase family protein [Acidobacteriota bacterium]
MSDHAPEPKLATSADPATSTPPPPAVQEPSKGPKVDSTEVGSVFVSNYPPFSFWNDDALTAYRDVLADPASKMRDGRESPLGLYLHIPFCRKRCKFCYFRVYIDKNAGDIQRYLDALATEVERYAEQPAIAQRPLRFVYFGGGTPSYPAVKHMRALFDRVRGALPWVDVEEVTLECEPGTLTQSKVAAYRELGITRLSLGVENWSEEILRENGRAHEVKEIHRCLPWIRDQGFDQLNVDLIAGMVGETWESWKTTVERTIDIDPDSVTIYQMELPFNTTYSQGILAGGESPVADWETKRAWNDHAIERFLDAGYEISSAYTVVKSKNHRKPGQGRFAYRDSLWHGADMLGTGIASFGHLGGVHAQNVTSWTEYLELVEAGELPLGRAFPTSADERLTRELILQMKLGRLDLGYFRGKFDVDPLERYGDLFESLRERGMVDAIEPDHVELSRTGLLQVDSLLPAFYDARYQNARYT